MKVNGQSYRGIWHQGDDPPRVWIIDQRDLPHQFTLVELDSVRAVTDAIYHMAVRGAPLIGATGAYGVVVALNNHDGRQGDEARLEAWVEQECRRIAETRPTAVNLAWAVDEVKARICSQSGLAAKRRAALEAARAIADDEVRRCREIGAHGLEIIRRIHDRVRRPVNILTHCNAGWLACVDVGTATAPIYAAQEAGIPVHVWVDETRPLNQGARLTAWELLNQGVDHTVITDNAGGHLMQQGLVDLCIVGTDRTTATGDVANKVGTYLKALAARDCNVPFYVALPSSTIDWDMEDGFDIPIEDRDPDEVRIVHGLNKDGKAGVLVPPADSPARNPAFDITPAGLVTGLITERGICEASATGLGRLFPEKARKLKKAG